MKRLVISFCLLMFAAVCSAANFKVDPIYRTNMVMQRDRVIPLSGKAAPGTELTVKFKGKTFKTQAGKDGKWLVNLPPMKADSKNATLVIISGKKRFYIRNILVGEVIILSGQSHIATSYGYKLWEIRNTDKKRLPAETCKALEKELLDTLANTPANTSLRSCSVWSDGTASWFQGTNKDLRRFSVVGHNIALKLHKELKVPVALISMSRGSSSIDSWIPEEYFDRPCLKSQKDTIKKFLEFNKARKAKKLTNEQIEAYMVKFYDHPQWKRWKANHIKNGKLRGSVKNTLFHHGSVQATACFVNIASSVYPFPARAMIWWQGETNYWDKDGTYSQKLRILFEAYRKLWNMPELPITVILQGQRTFYAGLYSKVRLEQFKAVEGVANTYLVNNLMTPISEITMIHPYHEKIQSGKDAAALMLKHLFGRKNTMGSGPLFDSAKFENGKAIVSLRFAKGLKTSDGKAPVGFELAGKDKKYYPAKAKISGEKVIVSSEKVAAPCFVRFMWEDVKNVCNLVNAENLTAFPFDTQFAFFQKPNRINVK